MLSACELTRKVFGRKFFHCLPTAQNYNNCAGDASLSSHKVSNTTTTTACHRA